MAKKNKKTSRRGNATTNGTGSGISINQKKTAALARGATEEPCRAVRSSDERRAIVVLGMHRSGTSALTRVLNLCGAALPKKLMQPIANNNELGFWEPARIYQIHERLFSEIGSSWDDVADVAASFYDSSLANRFQHELQELVREEFGEAPLFVIKDPRICRLVPFWVEILHRVPAEVSFVLPIRNPLEVALSLQARDGMSINLGLLLWLRHFLSAERDSRGFARSFCHFENLLDDWRQVIERVSSELNIAFPRMSARSGAEIDAFLEDSARHQRKGDEEVLARRDVLGWVKTAYRWALAASAGGPTPDPDILDELNEQLTVAENAFGPMVAGERVKSAAAAQRASGFETEVRTLRTTLETKTAETENLQADLQAIQNRLAQSSEETSRLARQLEFRDEELTTLLEWSKTVVRWAAETITGNVPTSPQLGNVLQSLEVASAEQVPLLASEGIELAEREALRRQLEIAEQALAEMTRERDSAFAEREAVRQELAATATARDDALAEVAVVRGQVSSGEAELAEVRAQYQDLAARLQVVTAECGQALKERESALIDRERMQHEIDAVTQRYRQAVRAGEETAREHAASRVEISRLELALAEAKRAECTRAEELVALTAERDEALTQLNLVDTEREQLQTDYDELIKLQEAEKARSQQLVREYEVLQQEQAEKLAGIEAESVQVQELLTVRAKQISALDTERLKIAESLTKIRQERDTLRGRIETLAAKLERSQREAVNLKQQVDSLSAEAKRSEGEINTLARDLQLKQTATEERDALVVIQRGELERIKSSRAWKLVQPFRAVAGVGAVAGGKKRPGSKSL